MCKVIMILYFLYTLKGGMDNLPDTAVTSRIKILFNITMKRSLTAVHFIAGILTVDHLVTAAEVRDAASVFTLEFSHFAQSHWKIHRGFAMKNRSKQTIKQAKRMSLLSQLCNSPKMFQPVLHFVNKTKLSYKDTLEHIIQRTNIQILKLVF